MEEIKIIEVTEIETGYLDKINELLEQLTPNIRVDINELQEIIASDNNHLFILLYNKEIAGMLSLGNYRTLTGNKYWIEDVVVDNAFRGKTLGKKLVQHAIDYASKKKNAILMLTSNPSRIAANKLYQSIGFEQKQTNVYKMVLSEKI